MNCQFSLSVEHTLHGKPFVKSKLQNGDELLSTCKHIPNLSNCISSAFSAHFRAIFITLRFNWPDITINLYNKR